MIIRQYIVEWTDVKGTSFCYFERSIDEALKRKHEAQKKGFTPTMRKRTLLFPNFREIKPII